MNVLINAPVVAKMVTNVLAINQNVTATSKNANLKNAKKDAKLKNKNIIISTKDGYIRLYPFFLVLCVFDAVIKGCHILVCQIRNKIFSLNILFFVKKYKYFP